MHLQKQRGGQMTNIRSSVIGLLVVTVLALSVVASASAAELEQIPSEGGFTVASGASTLETTSGTKVACEKDSGKGKLTGSKTGESAVTFEKCKADGVSCTSAGAKSGDIEISIKSELVWLDKATGLAGEDLVLAKPVKITCLIVSVEVTGSTICPVEPLDTKTTELTLVCKATKGKQEFTEYENESGEKFKDTLKANGEEAGLTSSETLALEKEGEIKIILPGGLEIKPIGVKFAAGEKLKTLTFKNTNAVNPITFENETAAGIPGVLVFNEGANFSLQEIAAKKCGKKLAAGAECAISVTSANNGKKGTYELIWDGFFIQMRLQS
jgi:hypothetical protein